MQINHHLSNSNVSSLYEGLTFLNIIDEKQYIADSKPIFESTMGAHFRHVLEHYQCFFKQLDKRHFCYDLRQRNLRLETDLEYAKQVITEIITLMKRLNISADADSFCLSDETINAKIETSLLRELAFLQSHTTHHYAIIAAIARSLGIQPQPDFGIAIATRNHQLMLQEMEKTKCVR